MGLSDSDVSFVRCFGVMVLFLKSSHIKIICFISLLLSLVLIIWLIKQWDYIIIMRNIIEAVESQMQPLPHLPPAP